MRALPDPIAAALATGSAPLATCWIVTRADGAKLGFTDHDLPLTVEGVVCAPDTGWTAGAAHSELGASAGLMAASGVIDSTAIAEADIVKGVYDDARVECRRVLWSDPTASVLLWRGRITKLTRQGQAFTAEIEGPLGVLARVVGGAYGKRCDAELGDGRCRAAITGPSFNGVGAVLAVAGGRRLTVSGLDAFASGWFSGGRLSFTTGVEAGPSLRVADHRAGVAGVTLVLDAFPAEPIGVGDAFALVAGCDKSFATCAAKFSNGLNYRGFPDIPGDDFLTVVATAGALNDGGSRR